MSPTLEKFRYLAALGSGSLAVLVLAADRLHLSAPGFSRGQALLFLLSVIGLVMSLAGRQFGSWYKELAFQLLNTVLLLVLIEIAAGGISKLISLDSQEEENPIVDERQLKHYYQEVEWGIPYWQEEYYVVNNRLLYHPYTVWETAPFDGTYLNIMDTGLRETPNADCQDDAYLVFVFGGSTVYGTGSPDAQTIPAYLQEDITRLMNRPVCVMNFGQPGHVITQNVIKLMLQLQAGAVPDLVIFYGGVNEIIAFIQSGMPNAHHRQSTIAEIYNDAGNEVDEVTLSQKLVDEVSKTYTIGLIEHWFGPIRKENDSPELLAVPATNYATPENARQVRENYLNTYAIIQGLAQAYKFDFYIFWQPVIWVTDKPFTDEEREAAEKMDEKVQEFFRLVYDEIQQIPSQQYEQFYYIADALDGIDSFIYADRYHLTPEGNRVIADAMMEVVQEESLTD